LLVRDRRVPQGRQRAGAQQEGQQEQAGHLDHTRRELHFETTSLRA
jgi:hypothetical protein